jgi:hypothetical protein
VDDRRRHDADGISAWIGGEFKKKGGGVHVFLFLYFSPFLSRWTTSWFGVLISRKSRDEKGDDGDGQKPNVAPLDVSLPMTVLSSVGAGLKVSMTQM